MSKSFHKFEFWHLRNSLDEVNIYPKEMLDEFQLMSMLLSELMAMMMIMMIVVVIIIM